MTRSFSFLFALAFGVLAIGCGADCESNCEDSKDCVGADKSRDCAKYCEDVQQLSEDAGCEDQYDAYLSCTNDAEDICRVGDSCEREANRWQACLVEYCADPQDPTKCE